MVPDITPQLAVVPILINAGAAALPALIAGVASVAALIFKPRQLVRACRRHPGRALGVLFGIAGLTALIAFWPAGDATATGTGRPATSASASTTDWTRVALEIIREEQRRQSRGPAVTQQVSANAEGGTVDVATSDVDAQPAIFRGGIERTGYAGGPAPLGLQPLWEYEEPFAMFLSSPIVHADRVYAAWTLLDPPNSYGGLIALDAATGDLLWEIDERDDGEPFVGIFSSPAVSADGRYVVIGQGLHYDANCDLICVDTQTGEIKWVAPTLLHLESSPAIYGNLVVIGAGAIEVGSDRQPEGHPGYVLAVDLETGREVWRHDIADPESSPAVIDGIAYIGSGFNGNAVVALRTESEDALQASGKDRELWRRDTPYPALGPITIAGNLVLAGCGNGDFVFRAQNPAGAVLALDRDNGEVRWETALPDTVLGAIAVRDNLAICPVRNGEVIALDLDDGAIVWRQRINGSAAILGGPAVTEDLVYAVSQDGYLAILELQDGSVLERHYLNSERRPGTLGLSVSSPFVSDGRVYIGSETGGLRAFDGSTSR